MKNTDLIPILEKALALKSVRFTRMQSGAVQITTNFTDSFGDLIQIYVEEAGGLFILSDDASTIFDLEMRGVSLCCGYQGLLEKVQKAYNIRIYRKSLTAYARFENLLVVYHQLLQAIVLLNGVMEFRLLGELPEPVPD